MGRSIARAAEGHRPRTQNPLPSNEQGASWRLMRARRHRTFGSPRGDCVVNDCFLSRLSVYTMKNSHEIGRAVSCGSPREHLGKCAALTLLVGLAILPGIVIAQ